MDRALADGREVGRVTFRLRHEWVQGATINGVTLATCAHCETLRSAEEKQVVHIRRKVDEDERVTVAEPRCISPEGRFREPPMRREERGVVVARHETLPSVNGPGKGSI